MRKLALTLALAAAIIVILGIVVYAEAASIKVKSFGEDRTMRVLTVTGLIKPGDDLRVRVALDNALAADPDGGLFIEMHTPGGDSAASLGIARLVRDSGIGVLVRGDCTSGCGIAALGAERGHLFVIAGGKVGLHQCWTGPDYAPQADMGCTLTVANQLRRYGVPDAIIARMVHTGPNGMAYLSDVELRQVGARVKR